jgi:hypothetical protein
VTQRAAETRRLLLDVLDCAFDRRSWHGPNLTSALRGVTAAQASRRFGRRKTIWEQLLHAAYWKHVVLNKLSGTTRFARSGSNWPKAPAHPRDADWRADVAFLREEHRRLRDAIVRLPPGRLTPKVTWLIHGVAAHDPYHAGQIKLLRRLLNG